MGLGMRACKQAAPLWGQAAQRRAYKACAPAHAVLHISAAHGPLPLLDIRTLFHQMLHGIMAEKKKTSLLGVDGAAVKHFAKIYTYPGGIQDIVASSAPVFGAKGWEQQGHERSHEHKHERKSSDPKGEDLERSMRRARGKLRRLALANEFRWFVTLTIDPEKCDSFDGAMVVKKLNAWASNMVQRKGLRYILVPERHKSGRIHFHGFFNDCLEVVDSGHTDKQGHKIYNLPQWSLGFTTAIELYDDYVQAVGYVCKYVGKQGEKPAGRWYYSGGDLRDPEITYAEISPAELLAEYGEKTFVFYPPGKQMAIVNGIVPDQVQ